MTASAAAPRGQRVLLVAPSRRFLGGQAVQAERLLRRFAVEPGVDVQFLAADPALPVPLSALQRVKYLRTIATSAAYWLSLLWRVPRADVVHAFSASYWSFLLAPVPAMLVGRFLGKRVCLNYRSGEARDHLTRHPWAVPLIRLAHDIVTPSGYLRDVFAEFGLRASVVENFVEVDSLPFRRRTALPPHFLANRNFEAHYDVATVLRAFARIQRDVPHATLTVAGDGPLRDALHALADELALRQVSFVGAVPPEAMPGLYDAASVYLNSPRIDNMPNSVIEAFACGLPVVTTDAGGIPYIVRDGQNGRVVAAGDDAALAEAALDLLRHPDRALRLADTARAECLARYTWPAVRDRWLTLYGTAPAAHSARVAA
jgi:glycosyltransferase involved in cell wall biosynthesis